MESHYLTPGIMTDLGGQAVPPLTTLPEVARTVQGLLIHEGWAAHYGVQLTDPETVHLRPVSDLLEAVLARDDRPLEIAREPAGRTAASCRTFTVLTVALLRAIGVPSRARCGFARYFVPDWYEDHWVVEYLAGDTWKLADVQLDEVQKKTLNIDFDPLDLPREQFLTAIDAWPKVRSGAADPTRFGLSDGGPAGLTFLAGEVIHDRAALENLETLPWDGWNPMPGPEDEFNLAEFDRYASGETPVKLPTEVFNSRRNRLETL
jgi:hypothetical protein